MPASVTSMSSLTFAKDKVHGIYRALGGDRKATGNEVVLIRNGETVADVFPDWVSRSRLDEHYYMPFDLNVPFSLPRRPNMAESYRVDPPLSEMGRISAQLLARHLTERKIKPYVIYTAPTLACLQTARIIQEFYKKRAAPIRIEQALCTDSSGSGVWFDEDTLRKSDYKIDTNYKGISLKRTPPSEDDNRSEAEILASEMRGVFRTLADSKNGPVVFISDAMGTMSMCHLARNMLDVKMPKSLPEEHQRAADAYPPASASTFLVSKINKQLLFESSDLLNPLTFCGGSTMPNLDDGIDWRPAHTF